MTRKLSAVPPTTNDPHHTLTIDQVDELNRLHRTILVRGAMISSTLNDEETEGPAEAYRSVDSLQLEALRELADDIQAAARASAAIMTRAAERSTAEKGGAS